MDIITANEARQMFCPAENECALSYVMERVKEVAKETNGLEIYKKQVGLGLWNRLISATFIIVMKNLGYTYRIYGNKIMIVW